MNRLIVVPCFKRPKQTEKIIRRYANFKKTTLLVNMEGYTGQFMSALKTTFDKPNVHLRITTKRLPLGTIRKNTLSSIDVTNFRSVTMHDNDLILTEKDLDLLESTMLKSNLNFSSPDLQNVCKLNTYQTTRFGYCCITMRPSILSTIISKLSDVAANEDSELIYLLGNIGTAINLDRFETKFSDTTSDTTIANKNKKLQESAKFLQDKYGKHVVNILTRKSGKQFTVFTKYKPLVLILEGVDRSGKTSLIEEIDKKTSYSFLILDRGPIGYKAYGELYNKNNRPEDYDSLELQFHEVDHLCVYLYADEAIILARHIETNEDIMPFGIKKNNEVYDKYFQCSTLNKIKLDSGKFSTKRLAEKVLEKIKEMQNDE